MSISYRHGTTGYKLGCRCDICRKSATDYQMQYKNRLKANDPDKWRAIKRNEMKARRSKKPYLADVDRLRHKKDRDEANIPYIRRLLRKTMGAKAARTVPIELLELKQINLKLKRLIRPRNI